MSMLTRTSVWGPFRRLTVRVTSFAALYAAVVAVSLASAADGQTQPAAAPNTGFLRRIYRDDAGEHKYTVFVPAAYRADQKWPVLLYLHGAGSRGTDGRLPLIGGIGPQIEARAQTLPMLVVFPQCEDV